MFANLKMPRILMIALAVACFGLAPASAAEKPDARVELSVFKAGFIVGGSGGSGYLYYKGKAYALGVGGISLGATIGVSKAELIGEVFNLKQPSDIAGTYSAIGGSAVLGGGASVAELQNSKGVQLRVSGKSIGLELSVDLSGLQISLK